jgi:hypothetical protein
MWFRNAFAHGRISRDDTRAWINYCEGTTQQRELTDEYLTDIENKLREAGEWCSQVSSKMGISIDVIEV